MLTASILNVGAGACTVIQHPGPNQRITMIDINNAQTVRDYEREAALMLEAARKAVAAEKTDPIDWYHEILGSQPVWRFILTHPDNDHMAGLRHVLAGEIDVEHIWDLPNSKTCDSFRNENARLDWEAYQQIHRVPLGDGHPKRIAPLRFSANDYWQQDEITVLSPDDALR